MNTNVILAIFWRNFRSYFTSLTGYVFICAFCAACATAAFAPPQFWVANLANFNVLSWWFPLVLLFLIPAMTMGIWAEERRYGTDELLLTIPATDVAVVAGKYSAAISIFTACLGFSLLNWFWLARWGDPDLRLLATTYFGYWMLGLLMLAIGMVASFLTNNLTVAYVLGVAFNLPLVALSYSTDLFLSEEIAARLRPWTISTHLRDLGKGVVSLSSLAFFVLGTALALYLCIVLIGRRHWMGGKDGQSLWYHYLARALAMLAMVLSLLVIIDNSPRLSSARMDMTAERLNSLSPRTVKLLRGLPKDRRIRIDTFISPSVPETYTQTKLNIESVLDEFEAIAGDRIEVKSNPIKANTPQSAEAEQHFGIQPVPVVTKKRAALSREEIYMAVVVTSGLNKVVIPFFNLGMPVEYELIRSISTVSERSEPPQSSKKRDAKKDHAHDHAHGHPHDHEVAEGEDKTEEGQSDEDRKDSDKQGGGDSQNKSSGGSSQPGDEGDAPAEAPKKRLRKKIGVLATDAKLYGSFDFQRGMPTPNQPLVSELEKQHDVVQVRADQPITEEFDVLLAVQPSSLTPPQMANFIAKVKSGQPTVIFEDPMVFHDPSVPGTNAPKMPQNQMGMFGQPPPPQEKGDIKPLWNLLGIEFDADDVVCHDYCPNRQIRDLRQHGWVFVARSQTANLDLGDEVNPAFDDDPVTRGLHELMFLGPGSIRQAKATQLKFRPLVRTSHQTASFPSSQWQAYFQNQNQLDVFLRDFGRPRNQEFILAARITGEVEIGRPEKGSAEEEDYDPLEQKKSRVDVAVVADIDMLYGTFFRLYEQGENPDLPFSLVLDNVPFVLNVIDAVAGDERFLEIRTRRPAHRTLTTIEDQMEQQRDKVHEAREKAKESFDRAEREARGVLQEAVAKIRKDKKLSRSEKDRIAEEVRALQQKRLDAEIAKEQRKRRNAEILADQIANGAIERIQREGTIVAVLISPLFPAVMGFIIITLMRMKESETVSKERLIS